MGCDIHMFVEKHTEDGWQSADHYIKNPYYCISYVTGETEPEYEVQEIWSGQNYRLFYLLAGVRNEGDLTPISDPKGLPSDVTEFVRGESEKLGSDGHSHSYLSLSEIKAHKDDEGILKELIQRMEWRKKDMDLWGSDEKIRIVFWFDS